MINSKSHYKVKFLSVATFFLIWSFGNASTNDNKESTKINDAEKQNKNVKEGKDLPVTGKRTPIEMYKKLFEENRKIQLEAVKSLQKFGDNTQRYKLVNVMLTKLVSILADGKENLTQWGYVPGDPFPENETIKESVSKVLENTAMFGDMVLRLPDIVHDIYDRNKDWQILMSWAVWFCSESGVFQGPSGQLLNLMSQEINLIPKQEDYVNPFKFENQLKESIEKMKGTEKDGKKKSKTQKKKKERKKGPRLSGGHTEL